MLQIGMNLPEHPPSLGHYPHDFAVFHAEYTARIGVPAFLPA